MKQLLYLVVLACLAGCAEFPDLRGNVDEPAALVPPPPAPEVPAAPPPAAGPRETLATLGDVTEPGTWLKTPLVSVEQQGRVTAQSTGRSVEMRLIPIPGAPTAGSRASLLAFQALGVSLTDIAPLTVEPL